MRAISRPRKTDAIATTAHAGPQVVATNENGPRGPSSSNRCPGQGLKKEKPLGGLYRQAQWGCTPSPDGRGPSGARILADRFHPVEAEFREGGRRLGAGARPLAGSRPPARKAVVPRVECMRRPSIANRVESVNDCQG